MKLRIQKCIEKVIKELKLVDKCLRSGANIVKVVDKAVRHINIYGSITV